MADPFGAIPPPDSACRLTVVIPARDEAAVIARTLTALVSQRGLSGSPLDPTTFDVVIYANNCRDDTAACVRAFAARHPAPRIFTVEETLAPPQAHVGAARKRAMDAAAARYGERGAAVLAATDADTRPARDWIAQILAEIAGADAVMGRIFVEPHDWNALPAHTRRMLRDEDAYQLALSRVRAFLSPCAHDPWPRHWQRSGPSFALCVDAYHLAGGVPPVPVLEDIALYDALADAGGRIRHSPRVRVWTSGRTLSRASGGFGTRVADWSAGAANAVLLVEHPADTVARLTGRPPSVTHPPIPARDAVRLFDQLLTSLTDNAA